MKNIICIMFVLVICSAANAQDLKEADVPAAVKAKFALLYPEVKNVKWEKENGNYEAEFGQSKIETSIIFDAAANLIQTEHEIPVSELPKGVNDYSSQNLKSKKPVEATKILSASGVITYEAEIGNIDYLFDASGNFLIKDSDKDDDGIEDVD